MHLDLQKSQDWTWDQKTIGYHAVIKSQGTYLCKNKMWHGSQNYWAPLNLKFLEFNS